MVAWRRAGEGKVTAWYADIRRHLLDHVEGVGDDPVLRCVRGLTRVVCDGHRSKKTCGGASPKPYHHRPTNPCAPQPKDAHAGAGGEQARGHGLPHLKLLVRVARVLAPHHLVDGGLEVEHGRLRYCLGVDVSCMFCVLPTHHNNDRAPINISTTEESCQPTTTPTCWIPFRAMVGVTPDHSAAAPSCFTIFTAASIGPWYWSLACLVFVCMYVWVDVMIISDRTDPKIQRILFVLSKALHQVLSRWRKT